MQEHVDDDGGKKRQEGERVYIPQSRAKRHKICAQEHHQDGDEQREPVYEQGQALVFLQIDREQLVVAARQAVVAAFHVLPPQQENIAVGGEIVDAVADEHIVKAVLGDIVGQACAIVTQVEDVYVRIALQQEGGEAVRV